MFRPDNQTPKETGAVVKDVYIIYVYNIYVSVQGTGDSFSVSQNMLETRVVSVRQAIHNYIIYGVRGLCRETEGTV